MADLHENKFRRRPRSVDLLANLSCVLTIEFRCATVGSGLGTIATFAAINLLLFAQTQNVVIRLSFQKQHECVLAFVTGHNECEWSLSSGQQVKGFGLKTGALNNLINAQHLQVVPQWILFCVFTMGDLQAEHSFRAVGPASTASCCRSTQRARML